MCLTSFGIQPIHIGLELYGFTLAGLRGGGATDFFLRLQDVPRLLRRGRWTSLQALERYVQEGIYTEACQHFSQRVNVTLLELSALAADIFSYLCTLVGKGSCGSPLCLDNSVGTACSQRG